jgi:hypothetical protein
VRDQSGGRPIEVGSKCTVSDLLGVYGIIFGLNLSVEYAEEEVE